MYPEQLLVVVRMVVLIFVLAVILKKVFNLPPLSMKFTEVSHTYTHSCIHMHTHIHVHACVTAFIYEIKKVPF